MQAAYVVGRMMSPMKALNQLAIEMRFTNHACPTLSVGVTITTKRPYAASGKQV